MTHAELLARLARVARTRVREAVGRAALRALRRWPHLYPALEPALWVPKQSHLACPDCGEARWRFAGVARLERTPLAELGSLTLRRPTALYACTHCGVEVLVRPEVVPS